MGERFINRTQPSIEAQIANLADEVAYNNHDIDDGLRSGLITIDQLCELELFAGHHELVKQRHPDLQGRRLTSEIIRAMINTLVLDLTDTTLANLAQHQPATVDDVRQAPPLVAFSTSVRQQANELKSFLMENLYRHYRVMRMTTKARAIVRELFVAFMEEPRLLDHDYRRDDDVAQARAIADYIAGMTDPYALDEYARLFDARPEFR